MYFIHSTISLSADLHILPLVSTFFVGFGQTPCFVPTHTAHNNVIHIISITLLSLVLPSTTDFRNAGAVGNTKQNAKSNQYHSIVRSSKVQKAKQKARQLSKAEECST